MLTAVRLPIVLLAAAVLAGCGASGPTDEEQVVQRVREFGRASAAKDYVALCQRILSPSLVEQVTQVGLPCERALERGLGDVKDPRLSVGAVSVDGDVATAEIRTSASGQEPSRDTLRLEKVRGSWRVASLGK
jgi:hypothetical protein